MRVLTNAVRTSGNVAAGTHMPQHKTSALRESLGLRFLYQRERCARRALLPDQVDLARGRRRMHGSVHGRRDPRVQSLARISCASRLEAAHDTFVRRYGRRDRTGLAGHRARADPRFPDWPCNQVRVPEISVAAVWAGPSIDDVGNAWEDDATIKDLVARLAAQRTPLDDAQKAISDVITGTESRAAEKGKTDICGIVQDSQS
jgi:hypothetical protein